MSEPESEVAGLTLPQRIVEALLNAEDESARAQLIRDVPHRDDFDARTIEDITSMIVTFRENGETSKAALVSQWCDRLVIECCKGHSYEEGLVQYVTNKIVGHITGSTKDSLKHPDSHRSDSGCHYQMEVAMIERLVELFGEDAVTNKGLPEVRKLMTERFGNQTFVLLIFYSDFGEWAKVFQLLGKPAEILT
jgi:hypothetical protein